MNGQLNMLIIEDSERDFDLIVREFRQAGHAPQVERVQTAGEMADALLSHPWDVIISDHSLPQFNATQALHVLKEAGLDIPFVIVSGMIGEERAVDLMKAGATDYVSKQNLARLIPVVERELRDAADRLERRRIEAELAAMSHEREQTLSHRSALLDINNAVMAKLDRQSLFEAIFHAVRRTLPCDGLVITLRDAESKRLDRTMLEDGAILHSSDSVDGEAIFPDEPAGWVLRNQSLLQRMELDGEPMFPGEEKMFRRGIRSYIAAPLGTQDETFGVFALTSRVRAGFDESQTAFFESVCRQVSLALDNMLSYEQIATLKARLETENAYLIDEIKSEHNFEEMIGMSPNFLALIDKIRRVGPTDATVLITGESGTGKELVARALHSISLRKNKPLVKVNCAAISAGLVESELFGHVKGAFTGAVERRIGRFEFADGGTLFLDEVGELPMDTQVKLLRVLQEHEFEPVGSNRTVRVNVRLITATNRRLEDAVREGRFRADLFFRLNVVPIEIPPLRERRSDIPGLVSFIIGNYNRQFGRSIESVADESLARLVQYDWPGNIRELQNVLARAAVLSTGPVLKLDNEVLRSPVSQTQGPINTAVVSGPSEDSSPAAHGAHPLHEIDRRHITSVLAGTRWVIEGEHGAARVLGLHPNTLRSRMKKLNIQRPRAATA
jgi:formate hydrogenlyase transcriptional activator